ncbi:mono-ADP-ribosyltransferase sirtuin-6-like protein [Phytophthora infestans T30-4]|uniref:protein acetyllysine N-acetyltransferase n=1 Tax=Phytophthora infestans (strain T30-4) TaxID=403677 RepID=D0MRI7_PHYIT|nr:mono-ADP-ribosyltransferase sirtuin-6-like protein [Phytophthora infestans T30-4]EEY58106.1 mono-ADP-ribosyltransferase sirtuin-6-like protein [Phytophthora infestans T30-4]|eukprot:XP_002909292.1 mono-ADP-ribosyltransferase sirtuin-6-like protein [Phytophthora infestans T30-4]
MLASSAAFKRCRTTSDSDDYLPAAHNYQLAPMKALLRSARRDFCLDSLQNSFPIKSEEDSKPHEAALKHDNNSDQELDQKCRKLAELIANSRHLVAFTGAGISTSVGIPDYRGEHGIRTKNFKKRRTGEEDNGESNFNKLVPSTTHMALYELHRLGYLKHVVSQNVDNLHLKSGVPASALTEVHGNATHAKCETCEKIYTKDFPWTGLCDDSECVSTKRTVEQRLRARTRHGNGRLKRNVVGFDEPLGDIDLAIDECEAADVALVLGTSLRVEPFSEMAGDYAGSLCIVNLQTTTSKLDRRAEETGVRLFEKTDMVMEKMMQFLMKDPRYRVPKWTGEHPTSVFEPEHESKNLVNVLAGRMLS